MVLASKLSVIDICLICIPFSLLGGQHLQNLDASQ